MTGLYCWVMWAAALILDKQNVCTPDKAPCTPTPTPTNIVELQDDFADDFIECTLTHQVDNIEHYDCPGKRTKTLGGHEPFPSTTPLLYISFIGNESEPLIYEVPNVVEGKVCADRPPASPQCEPKPEYEPAIPHSTSLPALNGHYRADTKSPVITDGFLAGFRSASILQSGNDLYTAMGRLDVIFSIAIALCMSLVVYLLHWASDFSKRDRELQHNENDFGQRKNELDQRESDVKEREKKQKHHLEEIKGLRGKNEKLNEKLKIATKELEAAESTARAEAELKQAQDSCAEKQGELTATITSYDKTLEEARKECTDLKAEVEDARKQRVAAERMATTSNETVTDLEAQIARAKESISGYKTSLTVAHGALQEAQSKAHTDEITATAARESAVALETQLADASSTISKLEQDVLAAINARDQAEREAQDLRQHANITEEGDADEETASRSDDVTSSTSTTATKKKKKGHRAGVRHKKPKKPAEPEDIDAKPMIVDIKPEEAVENNANDNANYQRTLDMACEERRTAEQKAKEEGMKAAAAFEELDALKAQLADANNNNQGHHQIQLASLTQVVDQALDLIHKYSEMSAAHKQALKSAPSGQSGDNDNKVGRYFDQILSEMGENFAKIVSSDDRLDRALMEKIEALAIDALYKVKYAGKARNKKSEQSELNQQPRSLTGNTPLDGTDKHSPQSSKPNAEMLKAGPSTSGDEPGKGNNSALNANAKVFVGAPHPSSVDKRGISNGPFLKKGMEASQWAPEKS